VGEWRTMGLSYDPVGGRISVRLNGEEIREASVNLVRPHVVIFLQASAGTRSVTELKGFRLTQ
jgi:hypothetical protein